MSSKPVCDLLVSWEILDNRSIMEVTKIIVGGQQVRSRRDSPASEGNQNMTNHATLGISTITKESLASGKSADAKQKDTACSPKMHRQMSTKSGPIYLHPFMHPELIDPACCELRILCSPRSNLRITSVELDSNSKLLEFYDTVGEYLQTVKAEPNADRECYHARCTLDRNVFELIVKFFSLLDAKCLTIGSLSISFEHFEWPKESPTILASKAHSGSQMALSAGLSQSASAVGGTMSPTLGLQRMLQTSTFIGNPRLPNANTNANLACARSSSHGVLSGLLTGANAKVAGCAPPSTTACSTPQNRPLASNVTASSSSAGVYVEPPAGGREASLCSPSMSVCGVRLRMLAEKRFGMPCSAKAESPMLTVAATESDCMGEPAIPRCASDAVDRAPKRCAPPAVIDASTSDLRRFSEPLSMQQSQNGDTATLDDATAVDRRQTVNSSDIASSLANRNCRPERLQEEMFVYELASALYADLAEHVDRRVSQLEARLVALLDDRLARPHRSESPSASASAYAGCGNDGNVIAATSTIGDRVRP